MFKKGLAKGSLDHPRSDRRQSLLCYTILYYTILYYTMLCYAMLYYDKRGTMFVGFRLTNWSYPAQDDTTICSLLMISGYVIAIYFCWFVSV